MFSTPPETRPDPPLTVCRCHGKRGRRPLAVDHSDPIHALPDVDTFTAVVWEPTLPAMPEHAEQREFRSFPGHRPTVGGSAGVGLRDRRKHGCFLRAYKDVFTACPANPHPTAQARYVRRARLFAHMREAARRYISSVHVLHRGRGERWELAVDKPA